MDRKSRDARGEYLHPKGYHGASLLALDKLGRRKGYRLGCTIPGSGNAVFVRDDVDGGSPAIDAKRAWRPLTKGKDARPHQSARFERIQAEGVISYFEKCGAPLVEV